MVRTYSFVCNPPMVDIRDVQIPSHTLCHPFMSNHLSFCHHIFPLANGKIPPLTSLRMTKRGGSNDDFTKNNDFVRNEPSYNKTTILHASKNNTNQTNPNSPTKVISKRGTILPPNVDALGKTGAIAYATFELIYWSSIPIVAWFLSIYPSEDFQHALHVLLQQQQQYDYNDPSVKPFLFSIFFSLPSLIASSLSSEENFANFVEATKIPFLVAVLIWPNTWIRNEIVIRLARLMGATTEKGEE